MKPLQRICLLALCVLLCGVAAQAQGFPATVGVPFSFDLLQGNTQALSFTFEGYVVNFSYQGTPGTFPPGLTLSSAGVISGTPTTAGTYNAAVVLVVTVTPNLPGYPMSYPLATIPFTVKGGTGPALTADSGGLSFSLTAGASPAQRSFPISNHSATPQAVQISATGGSFLSVSGGGTVPAFGQLAVTVTVDPSRLGPGTYTGAIAISGTGSSLSVPVVVTVTGSQPLLSLSQTGLLFRTTSGGPAPPQQSFSVSNAGVGTLSFAVSTSTVSGGSWLSATPANATSTSSVSPPVTVQVNPAGLAAGTYYGQVTVAANGVPNSPQLVSVVLNVGAASATVDPDVRPTALIFVGKQGGASPAAKQIQITNLGTAPVSFSAATLYESTATGWLSVSPATGTVASGTPSTPSVTATIGSLAAGIYTGQIALQFAQPKTAHAVAVLLIVLPAGSVAAPEAKPESETATLEPKAGGCAPSKLLPVFSSLGQSFSTSAAWPSSIEVTVVDDCGSPVTTGSVITSFSSGDAPISLSSLNDGRWSGTWTPQNSLTTTISVTATAQTVAPALAGIATIGGTSNTNPGIPIVTSGGIVNAASNAPSTPVAPGSYISIYGSSLASGLTIATAPFPTTLGGTQVLLGGQAIPLYFTSDGQINALVPYGMATNATSQILVTHANAYSTPQALTVADGGPGVFLNNQGGGIAVGVKPDGTQYLVGSSTPTTAGDALVIYCAGLGNVNQPVDAGSVSPGSPLAMASNTVTVTIEGIQAQVLYAGLAPGFAGLYQVNVVVPSGVTANAAAPLVITAAGQSSPPAPIAVQ